MGTRFWSTPTTAHPPGGGSVRRPASVRTSATWPALADHAITASWIAGARPASTRTHGAVAGLAVTASVGGAVGGTGVSGCVTDRHAARPARIRPTAKATPALPRSAVVDPLAPL